MADQANLPKKEKHDVTRRDRIKIDLVREWAKTILSMKDEEVLRIWQSLGTIVNFEKTGE